MKKQYHSLDDKYLNTAMKTVKELKEIGLIWPKEEELFTSSFDNLNMIAMLQLQNIPNNLDVSYINRCDKTERDKESLQLIRNFFGKNISDLAKIYKDNVIKEAQISDKYGVEIFYEREKDLIFPSRIVLSKPEDSIHSIILASTLLETIKSKNIREFSYLWRDGKIIPIFLDLIFSKNLSFNKNNKDLYYVINIFKLWTFIKCTDFYKAVKLKREDSIYRYLGNVSTAVYIYPFMNGYINALKLEKLYRKNPKVVLEQIKKVIEGAKTTSDIIKELQVDRIDSSQIIEEKIKSLNLRKSK